MSALPTGPDCQCSRPQRLSGSELVPLPAPRLPLYHTACQEEGLSQDNWPPREERKGNEILPQPLTLIFHHRGRLAALPAGAPHLSRHPSWIFRRIVDAGSPLCSAQGLGLMARRAGKSSSDLPRSTAGQCGRVRDQEPAPGAPWTPVVQARQGPGR